MPDAAPVEGAPAAAPDGAPAGTPSYVTTEQLNTFAENVLGRISDIVASAATSRQPPTPAEPPPPSFDLRELNDALREGSPDAAEKLLRASEIIADRKVARVRREEVEPLRNVGLHNMEAIAKEMALKDRPYAKRFSKEIDSFLATAPAEVRANPQGWNEAYNLVVGRHEEELRREAVEAALRQEASKPPQPSPSASGYLDEAKTIPIPSPEEFLGENTKELMAHLGVRTADELARKRGYKSWPDYVKMAKQYDPDKQFDEESEFHPSKLYKNSPLGVKRSHARI